MREEPVGHRERDRRRAPPERPPGFDGVLDVRFDVPFAFALTFTLVPDLAFVFDVPLVPVVALVLVLEPAFVFALAFVFAFVFVLAFDFDRDVSADAGEVAPTCSCGCRAAT